MPSVDPKVILRLGSHAEKEYIEKSVRRLDGVIVGANLMEATPGATSSLIVAIAGRGKAVYIDPMTYAFGRYVDPVTGRRRDDLDWIKSEQKVKKSRRVERQFKRSYKALGLRLGGLFEEALTREKAISPADLGSSKQLRAVARAVTEYQLERTREEFAKDPEFEMADEIPTLPAVFAPYFYIEPSEAVAWTKVNLDLAREAAAHVTDVPVHAVVCADVSFLNDDDFLDQIAEELPATGVQGVWLWFSKFYEEGATLVQLRAFRGLVERLANHVTVFDMHGGYFSLALSRVGMTGISHGIGYGEQKDVVPVIGQSTPTVRYYVPPLRRRLGVLQVQRSFGKLGIKSAADFFARICDCVVCKGVIGDDLRKFSEFGDMHYSTPLSKRLAQTPAAAKRCRFHFLLRRFLERDAMITTSLKSVRNDFEASHTAWSDLPSIQAAEVDHLDRWRSALS